jgi:hypothetical protein
MSALLLYTAVALTLPPGPAKVQQVPIFKIEDEAGEWLTDIRAGASELEAR